MTTVGKSLNAESSTRAILGSSALTTKLRAEIARAAPFDSNVLVTGPSGSGKELVARSLHTQSARASGLFIPVDCASLLGELMASQLFGHVEGAFTGANYPALGCFRAADRGTIFLDEIGELELPLQARLLRTIQERVVTPVGSHQGIGIDVRIIAATNRDLQQEVAAGRFREDLFYRLNVVSIETLPLRLRRDDIPELAHSFLASLAEQGLPSCTLSPGAIEVLCDFDWPGNVRQLKNILEQAVITSDHALLNLSLLQQLLQHACCAAAPHAPVVPALAPPTTAGPCWTTLAKLERDHLLTTLETTYYNQSAAARLLGISRQALGRLIKKLQIEIPDLPGKPSPKH
jgi:DNA-binding NtrC family response regulator